MEDIKDVCISESQINNSIIYNCDLELCKANINGYDKYLHEHLLDIKCEINDKISNWDFLMFKGELKKRDEIINNLLGLLVVKGIIEENDMEEYVKSLEVMKRLTE